MTVRDTILSRIEAFCAEHSLSHRDFGYAAVQDGRLVDRLKQNLGTLKMIAKVEAFLADPPSPRPHRSTDQTTHPTQSAAGPQ